MNSDQMAAVPVAKVTRSHVMIYENLRSWYKSKHESFHTI